VQVFPRLLQTYGQLLHDSHISPGAQQKLVNQLLLKNNFCDTCF